MTNGRRIWWRNSVELLGVAAALHSYLFSNQQLTAQQSTAATGPLALRGVTVIDVADGKRLADQTVVVVGNRIQSMGTADKTQVPAGAQVVDAKGKFLIPGLWDLHVHPRRLAHVFYPMFVANGVTGIRDAGSEVPIDTLLLWRREILAGTRVGPPRQIISGQSLAGPQADCDRKTTNDSPQTCVVDSADAVHVVDSLKAAGADMIKPRGLETKALYLTIAAEARRQHIPFGGHIEWGAINTGLKYDEASDSGATIIDHDALGVDIFNCWGPSTTVEQCQPIADRFRKNGTWWVPTLMREGGFGPRSQDTRAKFDEMATQFWDAGTLPSGNWLHTAAAPAAGTGSDSMPRYADVALRVNMPILSGTDDGAPVVKTLPPGYTLHTELALYVAEGLTPLAALQAATLNPAKMLQATDSLGTVAQGKLADLILLDADPLADITNTTTIRAVVANGRYYDRAALDSLLVKARTDGQ